MSDDEPIPKRINVAVTPDTIRALQRLINDQGISLTEAVRRLVGYGDYVYSAITHENASITVSVGKTEREIILL